MKYLLIFLLAVNLTGCMPQAKPTEKVYTVEVRFRTDTNLLGTFVRDENKWPGHNGLRDQVFTFSELNDIDFGNLMTNYNLKVVSE